MSRPTRTRARNRLYLVGVLPALLMLLVSGRIGLLLLDESSGLSAYGAEEYAAAQGDFAANQVLNPFEPWLAPFDEGTARHRGDDLHGAVTAYEDALDEGVPAEWECKVRNNLALAHEGLGDAALEDEGRIAAELEWRTARDVLTECLEVEAADSDSVVRTKRTSVVIDERLAAKLQGRDPASAPTPTDPPPPAETLAERERRLEERDRRALEERRLLEQRRQEQQDLRGGAGSEAPPVPEW